MPPGLPCRTRTGAPVPTTAYSMRPRAVLAIVDETPSGIPTSLSWADCNRAWTRLLALREGLLDGLEVPPELSHAGRTERVGESLFELADDGVDLATLGRRAHELRAPVVRVRDAVDVATLLEIGDQLAHRLFRHLGPLSQGAHRRPRPVEVLEHRVVRRPDVGKAPLGQPRNDQPVERHEGLAQEHGGVGGVHVAGSCFAPPTGSCQWTGLLSILSLWTCYLSIVTTPNTSCSAPTRSPCSPPETRPVGPSWPSRSGSLPAGGRR